MTFNLYWHVPLKMILLHVLTDYYQSKVLHLLCNLMAAFFSYVIQTFWWFNEVCEQRFERPKVRHCRPRFVARER
jgi:hypothetical protein